MQAAAGIKDHAARRQLDPDDIGAGGGGLADEDGLAVGGEAQGVLPVLDLRVAAEQEPAVARLDQQDHAGVVHRVVQCGDDAQQRA